MSKITYAIIILIASAGWSAAADQLPQRERGDLAIRSRAILNKYCGECHKEGSARSSMSVLDHKQLVANRIPPPFVSKTGARSQILEFLDDGSMPPAGHPRPSDDEIDVLKKWVAADAPSYPKAFDTATTHRVLIEDFAQVLEKDRPFIRYVSMAHLVPVGTEAPSLKAAEFGLQKSLMAATEVLEPVSPKPVDDSATLYRFDIRKLGWGTSDLFAKVVDGQDVGAYSMNAFDLILLEYPDAAPLTGPDAARLNEVLKEMKQLRPIPFLKADWLSEALMGKTKPTMLAEELKSLNRLATSVAKTKPDGVLNEDFGSRKAIQATPPPLSANYPKDISAKVPPFAKLTFEVINEKGDPISVVDTEEPFTLKLNADSDGYFYLMLRASNGEITPMKVTGGNKFKADKSRILLPDKKTAPFVFQVFGLLNGKDKGKEHYILLASPDEIAPPVIVRSLHNRFPIWRFFPAEPAKPGSVQRVVAELEVNKKP